MRDRVAEEPGRDQQHDGSRDYLGDVAATHGRHSAPRRPGFVVAGGTGAPATLIIVARWAVAVRRPGGVRLVRLLPGIAGALDQGCIGRVVQPGMPFGWNARGLNRAGVGDPAAGAVSRAGTPFLVIDVAGRVGADAPALEQREQPGADIHAG